MVHDGAGAPFRDGGRLRVLTWNLQYAGTRRHHFFYDGGDAVSVPDSDVEDALRAIAEVLRRLDPDVLLLQEVDRRSRRTGYRDQLVAIRAAVPRASWVGTSIHRSAWVPHPPHAHLGPIDLHQGILSRVPLRRGRRYALAPLHEPPLRQAFNLHRALVTAEADTFAVATTHLSAFSRGDGTLPAQVARLVAWIDAQGERPWILGGDFNLLPPEDDPGRLGADAAEYADQPSPLLPLFARGRSVIPREELLLPAHATYLPPGAAGPDRVLDYLFVAPSVEIEHAWVEPIPTWLSDHRPVLADCRLRT